MNFYAFKYESDIYSPQWLHFGNNSKSVNLPEHFLWGRLHTVSQ